LEYNLFSYLNLFDWMFQGHKPQVSPGVRTASIANGNILIRPPTDLNWEVFLNSGELFSFDIYAKFFPVLMIPDLSNTCWLEYHISFLLCDINITTEHPLLPKDL
jgi:hypothetical protein